MTLMMIKEYLKSIVYRLRGEYTIEQLKKLGLQIGKNYDFQLGFELDPSHCWLISIGDNVTFAPHVQILAHDASTCITNGYAKIGKVLIGNNVFIGAGSIVLPNVTIGDNSIIGAGSVVTHSIPANMVAVGNPAKVVCSVADFAARNAERMKASPVYEEEYTLRAGVSDRKKKQMIEELENRIGFVK